MPSIVVEMLPTVPTGKPQDGERKTRTSSDSNKVSLVSYWNGLHWSHFSHFGGRKSVYSDYLRLLHEVCLGQGTAYQGSCWCCWCHERGKFYLISLNLIIEHYLTFFIQLFFVLGLPSVITTDQGSEFRNQLNAELTTTFGIKHRLTTAYHPQANGLDERYNQTLINSLSKFAQQCRGKWDDKLAEVVYAYNTAVQESSRCTPFEAMFGRQAKLPIDFNLDEDYDPDKKLKQHLDSHDPPEEAIAMNRRASGLSGKRRKRKRKRTRKRNPETETETGITLITLGHTRMRIRSGRMLEIS